MQSDLSSITIFFVFLHCPGKASRYLTSIAMQKFSSFLCPFPIAKPSSAADMSGHNLKNSAKLEALLLSSDGQRLQSGILHGVRLS